MSKVHLSIKTTFGHPKGGRIRQVSLYSRHKKENQIKEAKE